MSDRYFMTFAQYNAWANRRLYDACGKLSEHAYMAPRKSFFGSIHATLNHLMVGDRIWLGRIEGRPVNLALNQILYGDLTALRVARVAEDERLIRLVENIEQDALDRPLDYRNTKGERFQTPLRIVLAHLFNHQTHHRAQVHDMLSQTEVAPPVLDLIAFVRDPGVP
ncbi:MAG TPA: DinB family protein [Stellaceae bacterium]|nr:DinB family protein [Stellaceae bacterium]